MKYGDLCGCIVRFQLYADSCKMIHYTCQESHIHELSDKLRDTILEFSDSFAEQSFGLFGKPEMNDFNCVNSLKIETINTLSGICKKCTDLAEGIRDTMSSSKKANSILSLIDDFCGDLAQINFLATFDTHTNSKLTEASIKDYLTAGAIGLSSMLGSCSDNSAENCESNVEYAISEDEITDFIISNGGDPEDYKLRQRVKTYLSDNNL